MSLRAADLRFVAPHPVQTAAVLPAPNQALAALADGMRNAGISLATGSGTPVDLVVTTAAELHEALAIPATTWLALGRVELSGLRRYGRTSQQLLVRGSLTAPNALVPMDRSDALRHYLNALAAPPLARHRLRNRIVDTALRAGLPAARILSTPTQVTLIGQPGQRAVSPAFVRAVAAELGVAGDLSWVLALGRGDDLQRAVFHLLEHGRARWVLKFSRVRGADQSFARDQAGLRLAHAGGRAVAAHAPEHLIRLELDGLPASVETAAPGRPLLDLLRARPDQLVDAVAEWVVRMSVDTARPPRALVPELQRLRNEVLPAWRSNGVSSDMLSSIAELPAVLTHNDLGSWNVISDGHRFTAVDWESARPAGLPLWDLLYLLADVLARYDGPAGPQELLRRAHALFLGRSPHSSRLFRWVRCAVDALHLPPDSVGTVATVCWLHHGLSPARRSVTLAGAPPAPTGHLARMAEVWLTDSALGTGWSVWRG